MLQNIFAATVVACLLLASGVLSQPQQQCYNQSNCAGDVVPGPTTAEECCVGTDDGMSFGVSGGSCPTPQCIVHGFENVRYSVREREEMEDGMDEEEGQDRVDTTFKFNVKGTTAFGAISLLGDITTEAGPNTEDSDFQSLTLRNERATPTEGISIQLFSDNDAITLEYNDTVILRFTANPGLASLISQLEMAGEYIRDNATVDIIDNDQLEINFRELDYVVNEGDQEGSVVLRFREVQTPFNVTLRPVTITEARDPDGFNVSAFVQPVTEDAQATPDADYNTADFNTTSITITIPAGSTEYDIRNTFFFDDEINEIDQSFALVGELGDDVPDRFACFQRRTGDDLCFGRTGATTIKIEDNDDMIIGFRTNMTIRSEMLAEFSIDIHSRITSEVEYTIGFRHIRQGAVATVETSDIFDPIFDNDFDAQFGDRPNPDNAGDPLETTRILQVGRLEPVRPLRTTIFPDVRPEGNETYIISVFVIDTVTGGGRVNYDCNDNADNPDDFFCDHTVLIVDDDDPFEVGYVQTIYTVIEDEGPVRVCVNLTKPAIDIEEEMVFVESFDFSSSVSIPENCNTPAMPDPFNFLTQSYEMITFSDYEQQQLLSNRIRNIGINATRRVICYDQPIYNDLRLEPAEYFGMTLTVQGMPPTTVLTEVRPMYDLVAICILDDDVAVVGLEKTFYQVSEDVGVVEVCAIVYSPTIDCPINFPFDVSLSTDDNTAVSPMDYIGLSTILSFPACETKQCVDVTIVDDEVLENVESFDVTLERTPGLDGRITLDPVDGVVEITDDDEAIVGLEKTFYQVTEDVGVVEVCAIVYSPNANLTCPISFPFDVSLSTGDDSAVAPMDYIGLSTILMFEACQRRRCVNVTIVDDEVLEREVESFTVTLQRTTGLNNRITLNPVDGVVEITDNDEAVVGLEKTFYQVSEDVGVVEVCAIVYSPIITCPVAFPFDVRLSTEDFTAVTPMDYIGLSTILSFPACGTRECVNVTIVDDSVLENVESFDVTLERTPALDMRITLDPVDGVVEITDDDEAVVGLERTLYQVTENVGVVEVCAIVYEPNGNLVCPITFPFNVSLSTGDDSAVAPMDYLDLFTILIFGACQRRSCVTVTIVDDDILEMTESFDVTLERTPGLDMRITLDPVDGVVEITDDDEAIVGLERTLYQVSEDVGVVEVCAIVYEPNGNLACPISFPFEVSLSTGDDSAVAPMDYLDLSTILMFGACQRRSCVTVTIVDDDILEMTESFDVTLERTPGLDSRITLNPVDGVVEITDNDEAVVGLEKTFYNVTEDVGAVEVCAIVYMPTIDCPINFPFDVRLSTRDGSADSPMDYMGRSTILSFPACGTKQCVDVTIVDDDVSEGDESFNVTLERTPGLNMRITLNPVDGIINIIENDKEPPPTAVIVNDTLTGDPLMTVPIWTDPNVEEGDTIVSLCYEVHGEADKFFNLVSDSCVTVNAHYSKAPIPGPGVDLNVVDAIGVKAVSNTGDCVNIRVGLQGCNTTVNGAVINMYRSNGITVRKYSNRVRISVPNCEDTDLVMWAFCTSGRTEDSNWDYHDFDFIRFVVMRGLNLAEESHGIMGQFWNIPVDVEEHLGDFNGAQRDDDYNITVNYPGSTPRSFVGIASTVTWEFEKRPCLYVGNSQAGPLGEDVVPNDSVIEGVYGDYEVDSMFASNFTFSHFEDSRC